MKATEAKLLGFLRQSPQFNIPIYQRTYSWTEKQCGQLWDDIMRAGSDKDIQAHFIGSIVYIQESLFQVSSQSPLLVIDGQQRLTTVSLLIEVLARHVSEGEPLDGFRQKNSAVTIFLIPLRTANSGTNCSSRRPTGRPSWQLSTRSYCRRNTPKGLKIISVSFKRESRNLVMMSPRSARDWTN